jgi:sigma-E factor negative regulatory protein RseA
MERVSALMDGELDRDETAGVMRSMNSQSELREAWSTYHLIGDAMRGERVGASGVGQAVATKLSAEPTVLAPQRDSAGVAKRFVLPSLAAAAAVAMVTWVTIETQQGSGGPGISGPLVEVVVPATSAIPQSTALTELVQASTSLPSAPPPQIQFRDRRIDGFLRAPLEVSRS